MHAHPHLTHTHIQFTHTGGGNPEPQIAVLGTFLAQLCSFAHANEERTRRLTQNRIQRERLNTGDVEAAGIIGGTARNLQPTQTTAAAAAPTGAAPTVPVPGGKKGAFEQYFQSRTEANRQTLQQDQALHQMLLRREELESAKMTVDTIKTQIQLLERKLERLERQGREDSDLYEKLQNKVDSLYEKL